MPKVNCIDNKKGCCQVIKDIVGIDFNVSNRECKLCDNQSTPRNWNQITRGLAAAGLKEQGEEWKYLYNNGTLMKYRFNEFFKRITCVTLREHDNRWKVFEKEFGKRWPFKKPEKIFAIDGKRCKAPDWWTAGNPAWGCYRSHLRIIEECLNNNTESILLMEDDAKLVGDFEKKIKLFLAQLPCDWDMVYLGGQHLHVDDYPPKKVNNWVYIPYNVNRTHAFALRKKIIGPIYRYLCSSDWEKSNHIDHHLGRFVQKNYKSKQWKIYCPKVWLIGQREGKSNISGKQHETRFWPSSEKTSAATDEPFVAVIGLHRSGSSCLAMMLHKLGVHMGNRLVGYEGRHGGGGEAQQLAQICENIVRFPSTELSWSQQEINQRLRNWINERRREAKQKGTVAGGKYPHLCALLPNLKHILGDELYVIHINRPLNESIESLKNRSRKAKGGWIGVSDEEAENVQKWLWKCKMDHIPEYRLDLEYEEVLNDSSSVIRKIIKFLSINPSDIQIQEAINHVNPKFRSVF